MSAICAGSDVPAYLPTYPTYVAMSIDTEQKCVNEKSKATRSLFGFSGCSGTVCYGDCEQ